MTLNQLNYYVEIVRQGSFTKAAEKLFVSQSTLSKAIRALEEEFQMELINRGAKEFQLMKPTAFLINTSRGTVVDEEALIKALKEKQIAGAALDVLKKEPMEKDNPLLDMDNVVTAPHIGGATKEASSRSSLICAQGIDDFLSGRKPEFVVPPMRDMVK